MTVDINRPDEDTMWKLLKENPGNAVGAILRLSWLQGMTREEICSLTWGDIYTEKKIIALKDREIPLNDDTQQCLHLRITASSNMSPYVVASEKYQDAMAPSSVSRLVRKTLDRAGMPHVRLTDLRHDYVIRQIEEHGWAYAIRVSGLSVDTFQRTYAGLKLHQNVKSQCLSKENGEYQMWKVLQDSKDTPAGIALWLRWQMNLQLTEIAALTWDQIDFQENVIRLEQRTIPLALSVRSVLLREYAHRAEGEDPHVVLSPGIRHPMDVARISKLMRTALIRGNVENVTIRYLRGNTQKDSEKVQIEHLARTQGYLLRADVVAALQVSPATAHARLKELTEKGRLVRVNSTYYPPGAVAAPEQQEESVRAYLTENGKGCLMELAKHLGLQERQCGRILKQMVLAGVLCNEKGVYTLSAPAAGQKRNFADEQKATGK